MGDEEGAMEVHFDFCIDGRRQPPSSDLVSNVFNYLAPLTNSDNVLFYRYSRQRWIFDLSIEAPSSVISTGRPPAHHNPPSSDASNPPSPKSSEPWPGTMTTSSGLQSCLALPCGSRGVKLHQSMPCRVVSLEIPTVSYRTDDPLADVKGSNSGPRYSPCPQTEDWRNTRRCETRRREFKFSHFHIGILLNRDLLRNEAADGVYSRLSRGVLLKGNL